MDSVVIKFLSAVHFRKAATSCCCRTETAHFLLIQNQAVNQVTWMYLDSPTDRRRVPALTASTKPLAKTFFVPSSG